MTRALFPRILVLAAFYPWLCCAANDSGNVPIDAKLVHSLQIGHVKVGDPVLAKVQVAWQDATCQLREGAIVRGQVLLQTPRSKTNKTSELAVSFDSGECNGSQMKPLPLIVAALVVADPARNLEDYESMPMNAAIGAIGSGSVDRNGSGYQKPNPMQSAVARNNLPPVNRKGPSTIKTGDVVGIDGVKISVANGPQGSSVISSRHNLNLEAGTRFILVFDSNSPKSSAASAPAPAPPAIASITHPAAESAKPAEPPPFVDETEICAPPACNLDLPSGEGESAAHSWKTVPIKKLGYPPLPTQEMFVFDHEAAIAFLGPDKLLFTFNPHTLVARPGLESEVKTMRIIRADLIDLATMKVEKVLEWRVPDENQYLWPLANHRVMIHAGRDLKIYGDGLKLEQSISLEGPLAFARPSPSGEYTAIGVTSERHSPEIHQQLQQAEGREPEEDVNLRVVDSTLKPVMSLTLSSWAQPPVLMNGGEVQVANSGGSHWNITFHSWTGEHRVVSRAISTCRPQISSLPPDLLFVVGCHLNEYGRWYRVLSADGKPMLKGQSASNELEQNISGSASGKSFALGVAKVDQSRNADDVFHATDIKSQQVAIYNSTDGKRLLSVSVADPVPTRQAFALSPDGRQLVVLQAGQLSLYQIPPMLAPASNPRPERISMERR